MHQPEENPWRITGEKAIYDNPWIKVTEYQVLNPSGNPGIYGKVHFKNVAVGIIPLDEELNIYLVGQYRFTLNRYSWEIVEGGCPEGSDPLESAQRELLEETGFKAEYWLLIQHMDLSNSVSDEEGIIYLCRNLHHYDAQPEDTEQLVIKKVSISEAYRMVCNNEITDSMSVAGILRVQLLLAEGHLL